MKIGTVIGRFAMLGACAAALGACSSAPPLFSADGRPTQEISCPAYGGWRNCMDNAKALCPGGYDLVDQSSDDSKNTMLIACKGGASQ
jgi:hypothetical protein